MAQRRRKRPRVPDIHAVFRLVRETAVEALVDHVEDWAYEERDQFVSDIEDQVFPSFAEVPLTEAWLERKERAGADLRTMIATGNYTGRIRVFRNKLRRGKGAHFKVGFGRNDKVIDIYGQVRHVQLPGSTIRGLEAIAMVHDLGSVKAGVPARPHWAPHKHKMDLRAPQERVRAKEAVKKRLRTRLRGRVEVR